MNSSERVALSAVTRTYGLGVVGSVPPASLICAEDHVLAALVRSAPSLDVDLLMAHLTGGSLTVAGYCSIWAGRMDLLEGLERIRVTLPELFGFGLDDEVLAGIASSSLDLLVELARVDGDQAALISNCFDGRVLRSELCLLSELVESPRELLLQEGVLDADAQAALLGLFLSDMEGTREWHLLGVAFMSLVWRSLFVLLSGGEYVEYAVSVVETVNDLAAPVA